MDNRLYRRTVAGKLAWQRQDARVPLECRRVLGLIGDAETHPDNLRTRLHYSQAETLHILQELVELGLLEAEKAAEHHDLDFTGELDFSQPRKPGP